MRLWFLSLALLAALTAACGARVTIRLPARVRVGQPSVVARSPTPAVAVVLPVSATPSRAVGAVASPTRQTATVSVPTTTRHSASTVTARPSHTVAPTAAATPTRQSAAGAEEAVAGPTPADEEVAATTPTAPTTSVPTPPPRLPAVAGAYAVRFQQLRFGVRGEFVQIVNRGPDQDLSGWRLVSAGAGQAFTFPDGYILGQDETVTVHSGPGDVPAASGHLQWTTEPKWQNDDEEALLYDAQGTLVDRWPRD